MELIELSCRQPKLTPLFPAPTLIDTRMGHNHNQYLISEAQPPPGALHAAALQAAAAAAAATKISNVTNSNDPASVNSRIFVGNLNTFTINKDDVERIFARYGRVVGISMHKGYAFIQYTSELNARNAVAGEDERIYAGQPIDVNMANEPKPNRPSRKRACAQPNDWDYFYDAPTNAVLAQQAAMLTGSTISASSTALKRPRLEFLNGLKIPHVVGAPGGTPAPHSSRPPRPKPTRASRSPPKNNYGDDESFDILICGNCKLVFPDVERLLSHKKNPCKALLCSRCDKETHAADVRLTCASCREILCDAWQLLHHCQNHHSMQICLETELLGQGGDTGSRVDGSTCSSSSLIRDDEVMENLEKDAEGSDAGKNVNGTNGENYQQSLGCSD